MVSHDFLREYAELITRIDGAIKKTVELHKDRLRCAPGCSSCCTISSVLPLEAALLRQAISRLGEEGIMKLPVPSGISTCSLLVDGLCVVYQRRPLICRTHGLPIAYVDYERQAIDVSACPINFSDEYAFEQEELFFIDPYNAELLSLNEKFCITGGINPGVRVSMQSLLKNSLNGRVEEE